MSATLDKNKMNTELKALRLARKKLGISREQLAGVLGITYKTVERIENGRPPLSDDRRLKILNFLGIDKFRRGKIKKHGVVVPKKETRLFLITDNEKVIE